MEETRRKTSLTIPSNLQLPSSNHPQLQRHLSLSEAERTYIFSTNTTDNQAPGIRVGSGHSRSVSHGGGAINAQAGNLRPALKSAMKGGHQRALSQGQIQDATPRSGHSRVGSKTDFILPPTHKEADDSSREPSTAVVIARGHTRQASRSESVYTLRRQDLPPWWKRFLFCRSSKFEEYGFRNVVPNHIVPAKTQKRDHPNGKYMGNKIRTTKYTMLTFLPKNLLEQFHRVANIYFVFIQILNWVPELTVFGKEIAMIPLLIVLAATALKDLFEDRRRYASDKRINNSTCRVYHGETKRYVKIRWQDLNVGDIVHLSNNETVPADILLLKSSEPLGICYIDTCDLDGETNLKRRQVVRGFNERSNFTPSEFVSKLEIDAPTTKIYRFHGAMIHPSGERIPVNSDNLLLRESRLKNTSFVEGVVVYAGHETKAMLNNSGPRYKRSYLEQKMNIDVVWCVIILILLCAVGAIGCYLWLSKFSGEIPFLTSFDMADPKKESFYMFLRLIIILQILIPLALYVTIEVCKLFQVLIIHNSIELYDPHTDKKTECRAMNITENLGQIQYVFSDKTGTLTENRMVFRRCTIAGVDYNHPQSEEEKICLPNAPLPPVIPNTNLQIDLTHCDTNGRLSLHAQRCREFFTVLALCNTVVVSESPHRDCMNASGVIEGSEENGVTLVKASDPLINDITDHYLRLSESRSVSPSPTPSNNSKLQPPNSLKMNHVPSLSPINSSAESSPESDSPPMRIKALTPTGRVKSIIDQVSKLPIVPSILASTGKSVKKFHISTKHKLLQTSSKNNVKAVTTNQYEAESPDELALVNSSFAYNFILENRNPNTVLINEPNDGLVEYEILKVLPFDSNRKCMSIVVRKIGGHDVMLYTKGADSTILPALAKCTNDSEEYKLRERTQHQLDLYARQGLRVLVFAKRNLNPIEFSEWYSQHQEYEMSTDNREKKIRESFGLLERNLTLIGATGIEDRLQEDVPETIDSLLQAGIVVWVLTGDKTETAINIAYSAKLFHSQMEILKLTARSRDAAENCIKFYMDEIEKQLIEAGGNDLKNRALVVDGKTLTFILDPKSNLTVPFLELTRYCASVLCCRSTPLQKAYLVKVVKEEQKMSTLAIGDGANDVSMLQMADVGIGICGQEGMQAVMASDFAIAKFKILEKLLLIHGHLNYDRLAKLIIYFFYKNATFVFVLFWFQLYSGFSGSVMMEQMYVMIYNFLFTAVPPIAVGAFEKRLHEDILIKNPKLYRWGRLGKGYKNQFWLVMLDSLWQSLVIFFIAVKAYDDSTVGLWEFGATIVSSCIITMLCHFALEVRTWTIIHVGAIAFSLLSFLTFAFVYNTYCTTFMGLPNTARTIQDTMSNVVFYEIIILTPVLALLPRYFIRSLKNSIKPSDDIIVQLESKREIKRESHTIRTRL
ncbi:hypothetical protein PVAND_006470 [Polypedilum vanderplanki]|uniref:Phospholipid-transporting ATPase n=1 Tax=Polypedilum vanderplanki TaxID=319348 RepID=A0A9J6C4A0_POLVA|nr:hypothetical protein PVAND_006470 [Polypedilum vanderplanki]